MNFQNFTQTDLIIIAVTVIGVVFTGFCAYYAKKQYNLQKKELEQHGNTSSGGISKFIITSGRNNRL